MKDRAFGPTSVEYPAIVSDGSSAEVTKPNSVFGGDSVSVLWLCVVHHLSAFAMDAPSAEVDSIRLPEELRPVPGDLKAPVVQSARTVNGILLQRRGEGS